LAALLTGSYAVLLAIGAWHHALWRDEMQAWLIACRLPSLSAILEQAHYEGTPPLWSLMLRPLALMTHRPEAMQALTWVLAGITMFLFTYFSPFSRLLKVLLVCNYYLLFEYGIVCRNYLPGILALTMACIVFPSARERPWPLAIWLTVAAFTSVHCLIVAVAMAAAFWGSACFRAMGRLRRPSADAGSFHFLPLLALASGITLAIYSMTPRPDTLYLPAQGWVMNWNPDRIAKVLWAFVWAHFPQPRPGGFFWIPPWDTPFPSFDNGVAFVLSGALFFSSILLLRRHLEALLFYAVGTLGLLAFLEVKYVGFLRHAGFLFFTFLFALWIRKSMADPSARTASLWNRGVTELALIAMLATQALTGLWAIRQNFSQPFSYGKVAAQVLKERHLDHVFIAVAPDWAGAPLAGYLDRDLYYPQSHRYGSFIRWDTGRADSLEDDEFMRMAIREAGGREMVVTFEHSLTKEFTEKYGLLTIASLMGSLTPFEDYHLYYRPGKVAPVIGSAAH
jgi:hypothetical protein